MIKTVTKYVSEIEMKTERNPDDLILVRFFQALHELRKDGGKGDLRIHLAMSETGSL